MRPAFFKSAVFQLPILLLLSATFAPAAFGLHVFFSASGTDPSVSQTTVTATGNNLYVWAVPTDADKTISEITLNIRVDASATVIVPTAFSVNNQVSEFPEAQRWIGTANGTLNPSNRSFGARGVPRGYIGLYKAYGFGGNSRISSLGHTSDDGHDAYLFGTLTYDVNAALINGPVNLFFGIGGASRAGPGSEDSFHAQILAFDPVTMQIVDPSVSFGDGDAPVKAHQSGMESALPDATLVGDQMILSIPEPALSAVCILAAPGRLRRIQREKLVNESI